MKLKEILLAIIIIVSLILLAGIAGQSDKDEFIEVNLEPKPRFIN